MASFVKKVGGVGAATLAAAAFTATGPAAWAKQTIVVPCSTAALSTAITQANNITATSGGTASLVLAAPCEYGLTLALPAITGRVTITGGTGTVIRRTTGTFRIFAVNPSASFTATSISILDGNAIVGTFGGGVFNNGGAVSLNSVVLGGNSADSGGGLYNAAGTSVINNTLVSSNNSTGATATDGGGGIYNLTGTVTLNNTRVNGNGALVENGGGVYTAVGATTFTNTAQATVIEGNFALVNGGGVYNAGTTTIANSLVQLNRAGAAGGGIFSTVLGGATIPGSVVQLNNPNNCTNVTGC